MGINLILAVAGALLSGALIALVVFLVGKNFKAKDPETRYRGQLDAILNDSEEYDGENDEDYTPKLGPIAKWNRMWGSNLAEISPTFSKDDARGGVAVVVLWVAIVALVTIFVQSPIAGVVLASVVLGVLYVALKLRANRKDDVIRHQLTGFLFAMKGNISANETPERALMKVIDKMPSPLLDELLPVKQKIIANVGFAESMAFLREETTSEDLRFLCSCMIQATATGVSLETQIDIILQAVEQKRRITEEITQATKSANMSMYAAGLIIPAGFIGIYILDEGARNYWFIDPTSWIALVVAALISFIGVRQARKFVSKVRDL